MRTLAALLSGLILLSAALLPGGHAFVVHAAIPHVVGTCAPSTAPQILSRSSETSNQKVCPNGSEYWAITLAIGATLTVNISDSKVDEYTLSVYGPTAGDVGTPVCQLGTYHTDQLVCLAGAGGRYLLGAVGTGTFTPTVKGVAAQAGRVAGACAPASAPTIHAGVTQYANTGLCGSAGTWQYWNIDLHLGDTVTLAAAPVAQTVEYSIELRHPSAPGAGGTALCQTGAYDATQLFCLIPLSGRYTIAVQNASTALTPTIRPAPAQAGRAPGGCSIATAPVVGSAITQYGHTKLCADTGEYQFWKIKLLAKDKLEVQANVNGYASGQIALYSPQTKTVSGSPMCSTGYNSGGPVPVRLPPCRIAKAGVYTIAFQYASFSFTPVALHPTQPFERAHVIVKGGGVTVNIATTIQSNTPHARGTCSVQKKSGTRWSNVVKKYTKTGACSEHFVAPRRSTLHLRVHFKGSPGWASSTGKPFTVVTH